MTSGDYLAIGILIVFGMLGLFRCFNWIFRLGLGLAVGCFVLVGLTRLTAVPIVSPIGQALGTGAITSSLTDGVDSLLDTFGLQLIRSAPARLPLPTRDGSDWMGQVQGADHGKEHRQPDPQDHPQEVLRRKEDSHRFGRLDS